MVEKGENQGVRPRLDDAQVSVSPQGFPSEKNVFRRKDFELRPLFTGQLFIVAEGLHRRDSPNGPTESRFLSVMAGLVPAIHVFLAATV
jgi:hypothetical protein